MFHGSIPADLRAIIHEHTASWAGQAEDIYVGCSGNFTIERVLHDSGFRLHGCDVQLYSSAIGWYLAGQELPITLRAESTPQLDWLDSYMDGRAGTLAVVLLGSRFFQWLGRDDHPYYGRMLAAYRHQFPELHAKTVAKIEALPLALASYAAMDVNQWLAEQVPGDAPVVAFPPFFAGDYESQFAALDKHLQWPAPEYPTLDDAAKQTLVERITDRPHWVLGLHFDVEELGGHLRGQVQTANRGLPINVYSSVPRSRIVRPSQRLELVKAPRLVPGQCLGDRLAIAPLSMGQFATLRSQYMNHNIRPGTPTMALAVLVDGVVVGAFAFSTPKYDPHNVYLLSDFPVAPTSYGRLAKLVLYAALSKEAQFLAQRTMNTRLTRLNTTAFTQRPVSMKYRGLLHLNSRKESTDPAYRYQLDYGAELGRWSLAEGYGRWRDRHGQAEGLKGPELERNEETAGGDPR
ncbi:hypothetical protein RCO28_30740 [Streptomyces sp. LHD-70]|uniref:putative antirestriction adenine methyltransferase n=1 Tax=Streptomyces sp. LHD-70 TaxID=3072140 RepID=UPI00280C9BF5|nr:hypothetical protein [Streptomyces sp. LHD-70]MDQ8706815.1 hypothetical protein [Streptomyces sp. LHD-70]